MIVVADSILFSTFIKNLVDVNCNSYIFLVYLLTYSFIPLIILLFIALFSFAKPIKLLLFCIFSTIFIQKEKRYHCMKYLIAVERKAEFSVSEKEVIRIKTSSFTRENMSCVIWFDKAHLTHQNHYT